MSRIPSSPGRDGDGDSLSRRRFLALGLAAAGAACRAHAENGLFASAAAADAGRAHPFCKCLVVPLEMVDRGVYEQLFVAADGREAVDRRQ